jgi:hypothetical protein
MSLRNLLSAVWFIHTAVFLALFALLGYIKLNNNNLLFFVALSFSGAMCGAFIRTIDAGRIK